MMKINVSKKIEEFKRRHLLIEKLVLSTSNMGRDSPIYSDRSTYNSYIKMTRIYLNDNNIRIKIRIPEKTNITFDKSRAVLIAKDLNRDYIFSGHYIDERYEYIILERKRRGGAPVAKQQGSSRLKFFEKILCIFNISLFYRHWRACYAQCRKCANSAYFNLGGYFYEKNY